MPSAHEREIEKLNKQLAQDKADEAERERLRRIKEAQLRQAEKRARVALQAAIGQWADEAKLDRRGQPYPHACGA